MQECHLNIYLESSKPIRRVRLQFSLESDVPKKKKINNDSK